MEERLLGMSLLDTATRASSIRPGLSVSRAIQIELTILDAAEERSPGGPAEDEGEAVGVVTVPHRDPAGAVG